MTRDDIRINARLSGEDAERFRELLQRRGGSVSDLLRDALNAYAASQQRPVRSALAALTASGYLAGGDGPVDLSSRYKDYLTEAVGNKLAWQVQDQAPDQAPE